MDKSRSKSVHRSMKELCEACWLEALRISWVIDGKICWHCQKRNEAILKWYQKNGN